MSKIGKRAILILLALPIGFNVMAQEIKKLTLEDLIPGGETYRYAENLYGLQWWGDVCIKPSTDTIYTVQPRTGKETVLTTLGQINKVLADNKAGKLPTPYSIRYPWADKPQMLLKISGKYIVYAFAAVESDRSAEYYGIIGNVLFKSFFQFILVVEYGFALYNECAGVVIFLYRLVWLRSR